MSKLDPIERIIQYHERSKHYPHRYAAGPQHMDWANQPDPFRRFAQCDVVSLALPEQDNTPAYESLYLPGAIPPAPVDFASVSRFFECSLALSAWKKYESARWALRINPSSGNLHPTEGYLVIGGKDPRIPGPGVYHYAPKEHALERRCEFPASVWDALMSEFPKSSFLVGLSSVHWREAWKYGERAYRYCQHDIGHALGAMRIAAAMLGWRLAVLEDLGDRDVAGILGLDRSDDFDGAEPEEPDLIALVCPSTGPGEWRRGLTAEGVRRIRAGIWVGRANRLSPQNVEWEAIDWTCQAARKPPTNTPLCRYNGTVDEEVHSSVTGPSARRIVFQRRSAVAFDGVTRITEAAFYRMLARVTPGPDASSVPWDCLSWTPRIDLLMFVHRVESLAPGLYVLLRDADRVEALRNEMRREFAWLRPASCPSHLSFFLLTEGEYSRRAATLSLGQSIAGEGAFSLGMLCRFQESLREFGAWFYRRLFWEAGLVGQVLYLEAEAAGLRATGIGAYFDQSVHELFGLAGRRFQSLYHFTVGGPVEDSRLTSLQPYERTAP